MALKEDYQPSNFKDKAAASERSLIGKIFVGIEKVILFIFVKLFAGFAYEKRFLTGKYFEHFWSVGYRWAFNGMIAKLFKGEGRGIPWPIGNGAVASRNIEFDVDDLHIFQLPIYYQALGGGKITIGSGAWIARNTSLITTNHDSFNPSVHVEPKDIEIGKNCWIGANAVILPGVKLGDHTVVAAGAVVSKSFEDGYCVIGGVPAKKLKDNLATNEGGTL